MPTQPDRPARTIKLLTRDGAGPPSPYAATGPAGSRQALRELLATLVEGRWVGLVLLGACLGGAGLYLFLATPVYRSQLMLQFEDRPTSSDQKEQGPRLEDSALPENELEIMRSRRVLSQVVDELNLDLRVEPRYLPVLGAAVARHWPGYRLPGTPPGYALGDERIRIERFETAPALAEQAVTLVARGGGRYELIGPDGAPLLSGEAGTVARGPAGAAVPLVTLLVAELEARPGTEFTVQRIGRNEVLEGLRRALSITQSPTSNTNVFPISLEGTAPRLVAATLDAIARAYQRQRIDRRNAELSRTMAFITGELDRLRAKVDTAEGALNDQLARSGNVSVAQEGRSALERLQAVEREISTLELQAVEARQRYTGEHPVMVSYREKLERLEAERSAIRARLRALPRAELESDRAARQLKAPSELYDGLERKLQELQVQYNSNLASIRLIDAAFVPDRPISPSQGKSMLLGLFAGIVLGIAGAFARGSLAHAGAEDPGVLERELGLPVYGSIPHAPSQVDAGARGRKAQAARMPVLARVDPTDPAVEALRSVRTSLRFAIAEATNGIVTVSGPSPGTGKSFVSVNLAHLLADAGIETLLVDADLRRGHLHRYFGLERDRGLADAVRGNAPVSECILRVADGLAFLPAGRAPPNPSELLASTRYAQLLTELAAKYEVVLVDTAPILAVTDAALAGQSAGTVLLVLKAGQHPLAEIALAVQRFRMSGVTPHALIVNDVRPGHGLRAGYRYYYEYR